MTDDAPGVEAWVERTSAFDRVRSVAGSLSRPRSATYVAEEAQVAENTARDHLERLAEMNVLLKTDREGTTLYSPDPLHTRLQIVRDLLEENDHDDLLELKAELQEGIESYREEYGVESPGELRERAAGTETAAETRDALEAASEWDLLQYRLLVVEDAIENYSSYRRDSRASA